MLEGCFAYCSVRIVANLFLVKCLLVLVIVLLCVGLHFNFKFLYIFINVIISDSHPGGGPNFYLIIFSKYNYNAKLRTLTFDTWEEETYLLALEEMLKIIKGWAGNHIYFCIGE